MIPYIKKYAILLVSALILSHLLPNVIMTIWPDLLSRELPGGIVKSLGTGFLFSTIEYLINIAFVVLLYKEMKKENIKSIPILVLTFFSSLMGVLFFLFVVAYEKMGLVKYNRYE
ncbi:hypothetical protein [Marinifilum flexuosum]|uniref:Uncharacterized protein n=1 Tax=Marinifilum flexuosum TaxID=1117708 RepID=A0A419WGG8_9BACT|nr:hypothetical protein [Marinifilum flexuosum]RKD94577.1 hypothetical protein BXY64_4165 [Marinifilum flexuosum]